MFLKNKIPQFLLNNSRACLYGTISLSTFGLLNYYSPSAYCYNNNSSALDIKIIGLNGNYLLAEEISEILGVPLTPRKCGKYNDGEVCFQVLENVRGKDVYIVQSLHTPIHDNIMEAILAISACRRASARRIILVAPYLAYSRSDRFKFGETIAAADVLHLFETAGVDDILSVDVHRRQMEGFVHTNGLDVGTEFPGVTLENVESLRLSVPHILEKDLFNPVIVCPSSSAVERGKKYLRLLETESMMADLAFVAPADKSGNIEADESICHHAVKDLDNHYLVGKVENCDVLIIDDMIDTASRVTIAAQLCKKHGAKRVFAYATHGLFSDNAIQKIKDSPIEEVIVTNTVPWSQDRWCGKIMYYSVGTLLAEVIRRKAKKQSLQIFTHVRP